MGSGWCCALTNFNQIRIFSQTGIQKHIISQGSPVVTMAGYESLLAIVYHGGPAMFGCPQMRLKMINMVNRDYRIIFDTECPVSRDSNLVWLGFSEEG